MTTVHGRCSSPTSPQLNVPFMMAYVSPRATTASTTGCRRCEGTHTKVVSAGDALRPATVTLAIVSINLRTKGLVARRELFAQFFVNEPFFAPLARTSKPVWNGEDILLSLAVLRRNNGRLNARHGDLTPHTYSLNTENAISGWHYHMPYRKELTKAILVTLGLGIPDWGFEEFDLPVVAEPPLLAPLPWEPGYLGVRPDHMSSSHPDTSPPQQAPVREAVRMHGRKPVPGLVDWLGAEAYGMAHALS
jgi:hypothetical protein